MWKYQKFTPSDFCALSFHLNTSHRKGWYGNRLHTSSFPERPAILYMVTKDGFSLQKQVLHDSTWKNPPFKICFSRSQLFSLKLREISSALNMFNEWKVISEMIVFHKNCNSAMLLHSCSFFNILGFPFHVWVSLQNQFPFVWNLHFILSCCCFHVILLSLSFLSSCWWISAALSHLFSPMKTLLIDN